MTFIEPLVGQRQSRETKKSIQACNDYLRMGPGRSLAKLCQTYTESGPENPPTKHVATLKTWSTTYGWSTRADAYDAEIERQKNEVLEARRLEALETGLALDYERVLKLKHLADSLAGEIWDEAGEFIEDKIWLPDVKSIGSGEYAKRVDIVRFNRPMLDEFRATLDDLAKETGGRKQRLEHTGKDGGPIKTQDMTEEERIERILSILAIAQQRKEQAQ